jgi:hypothetical protein
MKIESYEISCMPTPDQLKPQFVCPKHYRALAIDETEQLYGREAG